jgi:hypothetical protein
MALAAAFSNGVRVGRDLVLGGCLRFAVGVAEPTRPAAGRGSTTCIPKRRAYSPNLSSFDVLGGRRCRSMFM